jgi:hypothetical protein
MAAPTIALIEAAILAELDEISGLNVASYMGQMDNVGAGDPVVFPAAFPLYGGEKLSFVDGPNYRREQTWSIVVAAQSYAGGFAPLTNPTVGAYAVVESVLAKMANWKDTGLTGIERFTPQSVARLKLNRTEAWYVIAFEVGFDQTFIW